MCLIATQITGCVVDSLGCRNNRIKYSFSCITTLIFNKAVIILRRSAEYWCRALSCSFSIQTLYIAASNPELGYSGLPFGRRVCDCITKLSEDCEPNSTPITDLFMISESQLWLLKPTYLIALGWEQGLESSLELCLKVHTTVLSLWKRLRGNKYTIKWQTTFVAKSVAPKFSHFFPIWCNSESKFNIL